MRQSIHFKYKRTILLLVIILAVAIFFAFYLIKDGKDELASPISPPSVVSPVSIVVTAEPLDPTHKAAFLEGVQLYEEGEYEAAIEVFSKIIVASPFNVFAYDARGNTYTALEEYEKALDDYSSAIKLDKKFAQAYYNRGRVYSFLKRYDEALSDLQKSIELDPDNFGYRAQGNIGLIYHQAGQYDKALEAFKQSMSYDDTKADVFYLRGETYTALENYEAAIADYQAAITRFANYDLAYQSLGYAYYKTGQFDQALEALNQALAISPNSPIAHFYLALVYVAKKDFEEARTETSQAMSSIDTLPEEEQKSLFTRVLADLEAFVQENPEKAKEVDSIINLIP